MKWSLQEKKSILKNLRTLPANVVEIYAVAREDLQALGPVPKGWDVRKIDVNEYRLRLNYRYRIRYLVDEGIKIISITYLGHRKDAY